jgi:hypothetical protein
MFECLGCLQEKVVSVFSCWTQYCAIQLKLRKEHVVTFEEELGFATVFLSSNIQVLHSVKLLALSLSSLFSAVLYIVATEFTVLLYYLKSTT